MKQLLALLLLASIAHGDDWSQFRGSAGAGSSNESGLPVTWSKTQGIRWSAELPGRGLSSPVIAAGRLYVTTSGGVDDDRLSVLAFDAASGRKLWERRFRGTGPTQCHPKTCMAAPTPAADANGVYALFATGDLLALDRDGTLLWYRSLVEDYPSIGNNVGMAASPALHGGRLFVAMENVGDSFLTAIDTRTGANLWKQSRARKINWTTPLVVEHSGRVQVLIQSADDVASYEAASGSPLWRQAGKLPTIPSPAFADGLIYVAGGPSMALRPDGTKAWESDKLQSATASPTFYKGRLYVLNSSGIVTCADPKDGAVLWKTRTTGPHSASPVFAEDRMYLVNEKGLTSVLSLGAEPKVVAENSIEDGIFATPAISGGAIYLRSDRRLYCIGR